MSDERRTPGADRLGRRRPGAARRNAPGLGRANTHRDAERQQQRRKQTLREQAAVREDERHVERTRSRFTGRMAVLVLVLAVLAVSYASSLRAYLEQRSEIEAHEAEIARAEAAIEELRREQARWQDPAFVAQYAREHLGYVRPGETPYVVLDDGEPLGGAELPDPSTVITTNEPAWYDDLWRSTEVAGTPASEAPPPPASTIKDESDAS